MDFLRNFIRSLLFFALMLNAQEFGAYITPMCYTNPKQEGRITNPCYPCHIDGKAPNYYNEIALQLQYTFPKSMMQNPYTNLFVDRRASIAALDDATMRDYIRTSNYSPALRERFGCYFDFDVEGFDHDAKGELTLWRAFAYAPFMGTFFPTNGAMDDVMVRLPEMFARDTQGVFDVEIYKANFDALIDNILSRHPKPTPYVGAAHTIKADLGLYPVGTQFLHTVRYIDEVNGRLAPSARLKELRWARKEMHVDYATLEQLSHREIFEEPDEENLPYLRTYRGSGAAGFDNGMGWIYGGYIEDAKGALRVQNDTETRGCMGCHSLLGATTDSTFALPRIVQWGYQNIDGIADMHGEYAAYVRANPSGNEYGDNDEVRAKFFTPDQKERPEAFAQLKREISHLLLPSKARAMMLNKAYFLIVREQSFAQGRDASIEPAKHVHRRIEHLETGIREPIVAPSTPHQYYNK